MNPQQDEARAARIQKYKEERRKQLTARTATLFSANVTERRPRKNIDKESGASLKSSSEISLNTVAKSVPIKTTRTSRLRAAAASSVDSTTPRKSLRSASVTSLVDDVKTKLPRNSKLLDRNKTRNSTNRGQSCEEKENFKSTSSSCFNDIGATKKPKHSNNNNLLEKDKLVNGVNKLSGKRAVLNNSLDDKVKSESNKKSEKCMYENVPQTSAIIVNITNNDNNICDNLAIQTNVKLNLNDGILDKEKPYKNYTIVNKDIDSALKTDYHITSNGDANNIVTINNADDDLEVELSNQFSANDVAINGDAGFQELLDVVCVERVERFSELLSNLCAPCEADVLFEDVLAENGINTQQGTLPSSPPIAPPCRRAIPSPHAFTTTKQPAPGSLLVLPQVNPDTTGTTSKARNRRSIDSSHSKTENSLPSSKTSPKNILLSPKPDFPNKSPLTAPNHSRSYERRSSGSPQKPSCIPLSKKPSTNKSEVTKDTLIRTDNNSKQTTYRNKFINNNPNNKSRSDSESNCNGRRHRAQKDSKSVSEKYQYSKKRLTRLENVDSKVSDDDIKPSTNLIINKKIKNTFPKTEGIVDLAASKQLEDMSIIHETVIPHPNSSRLSQEMDSLAALTKQTLDRVNKLSNNLSSNKLHLDTSEPCFDALFASTTEHKDNSYSYGYGIRNDKLFHNRGVSERLKDIDTAAQRLIDFEKQSAMFSDLNRDVSSQNRRHDITNISYNHTPVSILKRKSINEDSSLSNTSSNAIASPPVTFSPNVIEPKDTRSHRQRQGILKKRRSLDESQVARRRSCSPEVSFADDESQDINKPILKNRRSSLEDVIRNRSPDNHIQGILKRKISKEEDHPHEDMSHGSPEPHGILKRKSNSSSSSSTTSSHVSIAQAVLLAAAGGAELIDDEKEIVRPILKKKSFSEERPSPEVSISDTPKPILKKKSIEHDDHDIDRPKKPILKTSKKLSGDDGGHASSFDLSEEDRSSRRPSLLRSRASDHSGSECETTVKPILKQRGSSLTRERSQSPRPRLSFCDNINQDRWEKINEEDKVIDTRNKPFPSIASRIKTLEEVLSNDTKKHNMSRSRPRDRDRFKTQPITVDEMRSITSSLEPGQTNFQAFVSDGGSSFPSRTAVISAVPLGRGHSLCGEPERDPYVDYKTWQSPPLRVSLLNVWSGCGLRNEPNQVDNIGEATLLEFDGGESVLRRQSALEEIEKEVDKVRVALDEDCRALEDDDERQQAEHDNWSLNASCDSGVYNRASSRDSGPHSGEELGLIESQDIKENHTANTSHEWSASTIEQGLLTMNRERKSTEVEASQLDVGSDDEDNGPDNGGFALGLVKSNSVVARASMWQQLQQEAKGCPRPLIRHSRSKVKEGLPIADRYKTQPITWNENEDNNKEENSSLSQSQSSANVLDRDEDAKLDEDDPAKMSLRDKMKMFNSKLTHKPPVAGIPKSKEERVARATRLKTMPVLASQVQEAMENNERMNKSMTQEIPRNSDFQRKMELFRSASAKNTSLEYIMKQNAKNRSLDLEDEEMPVEPAQRMITPEVRGILKSGSTAVPKPKILAKGESSEGLKDEGIDSSSDEDTVSASSVSSSEKSCSSSDSSNEIPSPKSKRFQTKNFLKNNKLQCSRTDSDLTRFHEAPRKIQMPCANELKERLNQVKRESVDNNIIPLLGKLRREAPKDENGINNFRHKRFGKKPEEPVQLAKLRRPLDKVTNSIQDVENKPPVLKISALNQEAKMKFFGLDPQKKEKTIDELAAAVRKYIPPVSKSLSTHVIEHVAPGSGSDGESSGGREVRQINTRGRQRVGSGLQRSATHADMPHLGGTTIAERLAALQEAGANNWRTRKCRLSPDRDDMKAIEIAKNRINDSLNASVEDNKKLQIEKTELAANILADKKNKLETAAQQWRARVPQNDANLFTVAGKLERDKIIATPPQTPPPVALVAASPGIPVPNKFRSRKQPTSPSNGFASGPLRSASCAVVSAAAIAVELKPVPKVDRESFKRSHSVSESISRLDEGEEKSSGAEKSGCSVTVPRADDETFQAFFTPVLEQLEKGVDLPDLDVDLDAIDSGSRQLLASEWTRRAKRERRHMASRNPLRALAARTDLRQEYSPPPSTGVRERLTRDLVVGNYGLAAEALAALATKEDFANVALRSAAMPTPPSQGTKSLMLLHVKGRRRVQTRLVEPTHTSVNRGDCFILVTPDILFLYIGIYANVIERSRSSDIALHIANSKDLGYKNSSGLITIDEQTKSYKNKNWNQFWSLLGVTEDIEEYTPIETGHADEDEIYESCIVQTNMCYEVINDELIPIQEYWGQAPKIEMLQLSKVIVYDFGSELYIWYGKNVPLDHRRKAAQLAQELFDNGYNYEECHVNPLDAATLQGAREELKASVKSAKSRPEWAILSKVTQHMETILFREKFLDWPDYTRVIKVKNQDNKANSAEIKPCDADEMWSNEYDEPDFVLEGTHIGRGTQYYDKETMRQFDIKTRSLTKWKIQEFDYQKVENESEIGEFFSGDSYIMRWDYQITVSGRELNGKPSKHNVTGRDRCAYFCWQGRDATPNEKGTAALLTVELDNEKKPQIRVSQGNEPPAFLNLFQGNLIIHQGKNGVDKTRYKLFITRGNVSNEAYLLQVPCSVRQLRSRGSLLLIDTVKNCLYIWHGAKSLKHTKAIAKELASKLISKKSSYLFTNDVKMIEVAEGEEPKEVLEALGSNKQLYNSFLSANEECDSNVTPRLFHFTDLGGQFEANEVLSPLRHQHLVTPFPFEQKELYTASQPALFLLDSGNAVWLWVGWWPRPDDGDLETVERNAGVGAFASRWQAMRAAALRTAASYWQVSRGGARGDVRVVAAGLEPRAFTDLFPTWEEHDDAAAANIAHGYKAGDIVSGAGELSRLTSCTAILPLAALQRRPLPDHVDPQHLERHLNSPDFLETFGMSKDDFSGLPAWKQTNMKKDIGLF